MPLKSAAGAEADPPVVTAFLKRSDLMAAQFAQRLWGPPPWTELQWVTLRNVIQMAEDN